MSYQKIGVIKMDFYGWRIKQWKFNSSNIEEKRQEMKNWIEKWQHKYRIEQIYVNNAWAVQYRLLLKQQFQTEGWLIYMRLHLFWLDKNWKKRGDCANNYNLIVDMENKTYKVYTNAFYGYYHPEDIEVKKKSDIEYYIEYLKRNGFTEME